MLPRLAEPCVIARRPGRARGPAPPAPSRSRSPECRHWRSTWRCRRPSCPRRSPRRARPCAACVPAGSLAFCASRSAKKAWRCARLSSPLTSSSNSSRSRRRALLERHGRPRCARSRRTTRRGLRRTPSAAAPPAGRSGPGSSRAGCSFSSRSRTAAALRHAPRPVDRRIRIRALQQRVDQPDLARPPRR